MPGSTTASAARPDRPGGERPSGFLRRPEVRDVLAWVRLLIDPQDSTAVVRALSRPPVELRQVDLARVIQVARRRKLDLVGGLGAATESPQVPPEARERIKRFVELHAAARAELDSLAPDRFVAGLIERLATRGRPLLAPEEAAEQRASLQLLRELAEEFVRERPRASSRELARHLAAMVPQPLRGEQPAGADRAEPSAAAEPGEEDGPLLELLHRLRAEVLEGVTRIGGRLGELRLDTDLDISHGIVRYLELLKVSALLQRPRGEELSHALEDVNLRLLAAATSLQREILLTSNLDEALLAAAGEQREGGAGGGAILPREEHSLGSFLPRRGAGVALSASDIATYRSCPLRYKFARVLRIPTEQTLHQRFGIVVHQVLERYHSTGGATLPELLALLDSGWRRAGLAGEAELYEKARTALVRYHARLADESSQPVWFERQFAFRLGPHHLRGRVDRVDRVTAGAGEAYELIDYKTSRPKTPEQLRDDVQLSLYALAAREAWQLESSEQAYYYVLDDVKVPVPRAAGDAEAVRETVLAVGDGILAQDFDPTPSPAACGICDYRTVCPAADH